MIRRYFSGEPDVADWEREVFIDDGDGEPEPLEPRRDLRDHSPGGFSWGYGGSGPSQLALAMAADCLGDDLALEHYQGVKRALVSEQPGEEAFEATSRQVVAASGVDGGACVDCGRLARETVQIASATRDHPGEHEYLCEDCQESRAEAADASRPPEGL